MDRGGLWSLEARSEHLAWTCAVLPTALSTVDRSGLKCLLESLNCLPTHFFLQLAGSLLHLINLCTRKHFTTLVTSKFGKTCFVLFLGGPWAWLFPLSPLPGQHLSTAFCSFCNVLARQQTYPPLGRCSCNKGNPSRTCPSSSPLIECGCAHAVMLSLPLFCTMIVVLRSPPTPRGPPTNPLVSVPAHSFCVDVCRRQC